MSLQNFFSLIRFRKRAVLNKEFVRNDKTVKIAILRAYRYRRASKKYPRFNHKFI